MATGPHLEESLTNQGVLQAGQVVKLDRGYPLVCLQDGTRLRCEHATELVKQGATRAVIGDYVQLSIPAEHDKAFIVDIQPRKRVFERKDPAERTVSQVLAANFDAIIIVQPVEELHIRRLERELVLAHETGADIMVALTKADLSDSETIEKAAQDVQARVGLQVPVVVLSPEDTGALQAIKDFIRPDKMAILMGKSGVGKSSLVNLLVGSDVQQTGAVRAHDGKGRHTTVSRELITLPSGGSVVDMPGVRGLGMWEAEAGIGAAFPVIDQAAQHCKFVDCQHESEPGCAVRAALEAGEITAEQLESYKNLMKETKDMRVRKEHARWQKQAPGRRKRH